MSSDISTLDDNLFKDLIDTTGGSLLPFITEYKKLQDTLRKSNNSENRFILKCKELTKNISTGTDKVHVLNAMIDEEKRQIESLNIQINSNKSRKETSSLDIEAKKELLQISKKDLNDLSKKLEDSSRDFMNEQEMIVHSMELKLDELTRRRDEERKELTSIRSENIESHAKYDAVMNAQMAEEAEIRALDEKINQTIADTQAVIRKKEELESNMREQQNIFRERQAQHKTRTSLLDQSKADANNAENQINEMERAAEDQTKNLQDLTNEVESYEKNLESIKDQNELQIKKLESLNAEFEIQNAQIEDAKKEGNKKIKLLNAIKQKVSEIETKTHIAEADKENKKAEEVDSLIAAEMVKQHSLDKQIDTCVREREVLSQNTMSKIESMKSKNQAYQMAASAIKTMESEVSGYKNKIVTLHEMIERLKEDKEAFVEEFEKKELVRDKAAEEMAKREMQMINLQKDISEHEARLKTQQNLLEGVRSDRNAYNKQLIQQKDDMNEQQRKFDLFNQRISSIKQEISDKDNDIIQQHILVQNVNIDIQELSRQIESVKKEIGEKELQIKSQASQLTKLTSIIAEADIEVVAQNKQLNNIVNEQRVLNLQLIQRNDELNELYEKLKLQHSILKKEEGSYKEKVVSIKQLQSQINNLTSELEDATNDQSEFELLDQAVSAVEIQLQTEKHRVRALEVELEKRVNVHRWRHLEDTDTGTFNLIKKVSDLQSQIIQKSDEVSNQDHEIQQKEKLYVDLRKVLARQPGPEAAEQLRVYAMTLKDKKSKYELMQAELKMYQSKVYEYQYEIDKLNSDLNVIKLSYFALRRQNDNPHESYSTTPYSPTPIRRLNTQERLYGQDELSQAAMAAVMAADNATSGVLRQEAIENEKYLMDANKSFLSSSPSK